MTALPHRPARPVDAGMQSLCVPAHPHTRASTLLVLLPGAHDTPQDLLAHGFAQAANQRQLPVDVLLADAHTGYYTAQQIVPRLLADVLQPARAQGYARIWLAGISLGGYGALLTACSHPAQVDGVFTMAAFLGRRDLPAAIARAGGLLAWDGNLPGADAQDLALWRWLRARARQAAPQPPLWMGWGEQDRFIASNRLLASTLPPAQVLTTHGGHEWAPWQRLWQRFLDAWPWR